MNGIVLINYSVTMLVIVLWNIMSLWVNVNESYPHELAICHHNHMRSRGFVIGVIAFGQSWAYLADVTFAIC